MVFTAKNFDELLLDLQKSKQALIINTVAKLLIGKHPNNNNNNNNNNNSNNNNNNINNNNNNDNDNNNGNNNNLYMADIISMFKYKSRGSWLLNCLLYTLSRTFFRK